MYATSPTFATITTRDGLLTADSAVTIGGETSPVKPRSAGGDLDARLRVIETLIGRGWQPASNYHNDLGEDPEPGEFRIRIRPIATVPANH